MRTKQKFRAGDKVEIVADSIGHGLSFGTILTVKSLQNNYVYFRENGSYASVLDLQAAREEKGKLLKHLVEKEKETRIIKDKISFLEETNADVFDAKEFRKYQLKKIIDDTSIAAEKKADYINDLYE